MTRFLLPYRAVFRSVPPAPSKSYEPYSAAVSTPDLSGACFYRGGLGASCAIRRRFIRKAFIHASRSGALHRNIGGSRASLPLGTA